MTASSLGKCTLLGSSVLAIAQGAAAAADGYATVGVGADYSSGKYGGAEKTQIFYLAVTGKYEHGPWIFRLTVPYVRITGPGNVVGAGADRVTLPDAGARPPRRTVSGLGDIVTAGFYNVMDERRSPFGLDVGAKMKLGTGDEAKGLGTGKNDLSLQADFFKVIGAAAAFATLGHRWYGSPAGVKLRDVYYGSVGISYRISSPTSIGLAYDFRPRISATGGTVSEVSGFVSHRLSQDWKIQFYALTGFSTGSPDFGAGALLNHSF